MTTQTLVQGTRSASILNLGTLASATYIASSSQDLGANIPLNKTLEVTALPSTTPTGNKKLDVFVQLSLDNTNFSTGPTSGTSPTNEADLLYIGSVPCNDSAAAHTRMFDLSGIPVARYVKVVCRNDMGVALTSGNVYWADITGSNA